MMSSKYWPCCSAMALLLLGFAQMTGDLCGSRNLKGIAAALAASPFPKVFCDVGGYEPFAAEFVLCYETAAGEVTERTITPEFYRQLKGSYNRRNAYGAALSYAPRLPPSLWNAVAVYGLRPGGPLRAELGLPEDITRLAIRISTRTRGRSETWLLEPAWSP